MAILPLDALAARRSRQQLARLPLDHDQPPPRELDQEPGRYAEAIATAGPLPSLLEALQNRERRRVTLQGELCVRSSRRIRRSPSRSSGGC
jgi:hypothetical protein